MGVLSGLMRSVGVKLSGRRSWTPAEVRGLIDVGELDAARDAAKALAAQTPQRMVIAACLCGEIAFRQQDDSTAETLFREALADVPSLPDAHYGLSLVLLARGETESALRHAQFAVNSGIAARFSAQLGLCQLDLGNFSRAEDALARATRLDPNDKSSWNNLGIARRAHGNLVGARAAFARALELDPGFERAKANARQLDEDAADPGIRGASQRDGRIAPAANALIADVQEMASEGSLANAIDACERLCTDQPDSAVLVTELYRLYREYGDAQNGLDALQAFLTRHPGDVDVTAALGIALVENAEFMQAKPLIQSALDARPNDVPLLLALSEIRFQQERYADAGAVLERAYALEPSVHMKGRLASNLIARCRYDEGLALIEEMLAEDPSVESDVLGLQIMALTYQGRHEDVLPKLNALIERTPHEPHRRFSRASINLLTENFGEGWDDYAFRNLDSTRHLRMLPFPVWDGQSLEGKSILVAAEQGLGDQVMFASCLADLLRLKPARVTVEVVDRIAPTIARSFPECRVVGTKQDKQLDWVRDVGHVDCFTLLGDLPRHLRRRREEFPSHSGYLVADASRVAHWAAQLGDIDSGRKLRIGLSWRGGTEATRTSIRTLNVTEFGAFSSAIDATWVCLQYGDVQSDLAAAAEGGLALHHWPQAIKNLDEFAALISALDLVVTVCNTTVHYAGALGQPVWVLAPKVPEWRYGLHSETMPWYPSSRVYRQSTAGQWRDVLMRVVADLSARNLG